MPVAMHETFRPCWVSARSASSTVRGDALRIGVGRTPTRRNSTWVNPASDAIRAWLGNVVSASSVNPVRVNTTPA